MSENTDTRTASQKIDDLERVVTMLYQSTSQIKNATESLLKTQTEVGMIKDVIKLLSKRIEAVIQTATPETGINSNSVSVLVTKMNVEELTSQVSAYVANGHLVATDTVADNSYLVAEEHNLDGTLANPRVQFRLDSQDEATVALLKGKKVGETVSFGENKFTATLLEIYDIVEPQAPEVAAPVEAAAPAAEAPAAATLEALPAETPVAQFVPSDPSTMATA